MKKNSWSRIYLVLLLANALYILLFIWIMNHYSA